MATKKTDADNSTRTTTDAAVNTSSHGVVNEAETRSSQEVGSKASKIVHTITAEKAEVGATTTDSAPDFVPAGTKPTQLQLLEQARAATASLDQRDAADKEQRKEYNENKKIEGRNVIKHMLRFVESFEDGSGQTDVTALNNFLDVHVGQPHGGAKNPYHRISKYCAVNDTAKTLVTKRAYVLDVLVKQNIPSSELDERFERKEEIGPDKLPRSGMQKYILLYELENGLAASAAEKFKKMKAERLIEQTQQMLGELLQRQMLPDKLVADLKKHLDEHLHESE